MALRQYVNDIEQDQFCTSGFSVSGYIISNTSLDIKSTVIVSHRELKCLSGVQTKFSSLPKQKQYFWKYLFININVLFEFLSERYGHIPSKYYYY